MGKATITPRIKFYYSDIYDIMWRRRWYDLRLDKKYKAEYPSPRSTVSYMNKIEPVWRLQEKKITKEMAKVTGLSWKEKTITCYVVGRCIPFSNPLTVIPWKDKSYFVDVLTHELIHQIFSQNEKSKRYQRAETKIERKYRSESQTTRNHILLHAVHAQIYMGLFDQERMERDISRIGYIKDYRRSWDIVMHEGYSNILKNLE